MKTLLSRLQKKKAVGTKKEKNHYLFSAIASEADCVRAESQYFLDRVFGGSVKSASWRILWKRKKLSIADLDELKKRPCAARNRLDLSTDRRQVRHSRARNAHGDFRARAGVGFNLENAAHIGSSLSRIPSRPKPPFPGW